MARPAKSVNTSTGKIGKEEIEKRKQAEKLLRGNANKVKPPAYLSITQKKIFKKIVSELQASGILCNLDIYILTTVSIAIDRLQSIESLINGDISNLTNKDLMAAKDKYTKDLFRCTNELSLSPQSRAKLANINVQAKNTEDDLLLKALRGDNI
ncbi:phage terminase small subunit P27 family [Clostridium felsineum]|uniref:Uncharacterized protein n=1 Tax=Clostridium felsineum TaxID=36839 RepID=A0A1S8L4L1_9CLOT|nr:phage terminase small subunit P27 family [Clostridium felsineum]URZ06778.1 hypothetical protein CLROS_021110 [Clostridium felsineum]URZ11810.1 hypothetical protein CROST_025270 [Clostridium felsineum]